MFIRGHMAANISLIVTAWLPLTYFKDDVTSVPHTLLTTGIRYWESDSDCLKEYFIQGLHLLSSNWTPAVGILTCILQMIFVARLFRQIHSSFLHLPHWAGRGFCWEKPTDIIAGKRHTSFWPHLSVPHCLVSVLFQFINISFHEKNGKQRFSLMTSEWLELAVLYFKFK